MQIKERMYLVTYLLTTVFSNLVEYVIGITYQLLEEVRDMKPKNLGD